MEKHVSEATIGEMDYMTAYLMVFQTDYIEKGNNLIFEEDYLDALNNDMNGILDSDFIASIEDKEVRDFYSALDKGYMTIIRYEETPVVEMDWSRLADLGLVFTEGLNYVVSARGGLELVDYEEYYGLAEKIVEAEALLKNEDSVFVKNQLLDLIATWSSYLVFGPEGTFYDYYMIKDYDLYDDMVDFSEDYAGTDFGDFMTDLVEADIQDFTEISKAYDRYINAIHGKGYEWIYRMDEDDLSSVRRMGYKSQTNETAKQKINTRIQSAVDTEIDKLKELSPYDIECVLTYDNGKWATIVISSSYQTSDTNRGYDSYGLSFNLETGDVVTLEDLLNLSEEDALIQVGELTDSRFDKIVSIEFMENGLLVEGKIEDDNETDYVTLTYKDIVSYNKLYTFEEVALDRYNKRPQDQLISSLEKLLASDMLTDDYVEYIEENISHASPEKAEKMIEALMIFQSETITAGNLLLDQPAYREALFAVEYEEDIERIEDIENEEIKKFFKHIEDSYLKVDNDEDILFLTMDWSKIEDLDTDFSKAFDYVIKMRSDDAYDFTEDYYDLAKETIRLEVMEDKVKSSFVKTQMEALYDEWTGELLIGEVGQNYGAYTEKSGPVYEEMMAFAQAYPSSALGRFLLELDALDSPSNDQVDHAMTAFFISENLGAKKWLPVVQEDKGSISQSLSYQEIGQSEKTDKMNVVMAELTKDLIDYAISNSTFEAPNYTIEMYPVYYDNRYVTLSMWIDYQHTTADNKFYSQLVTMDMKTGDHLTLDGYLDIYSEQAIAIVNNILETGYTIQPSIYMTETGIRLKANELDSYKSDDEHINKRTLIPYVGLENY